MLHRVAAQADRAVQNRRSSPHVSDLVSGTQR